MENSTNDLYVARLYSNMLPLSILARKATTIVDPGVPTHPSTNVDPNPISVSKVYKSEYLKERMHMDADSDRNIFGRLDMMKKEEKLRHIHFIHL
jgi:hypothetical protein